MQGVLASDAHGIAPYPIGFREACAAPPDGLRIAISRKVPPGLVARVSLDQRGAWESTALLLRDLGHQVIERDPPYGLAQLEFLQTWLRGIYETSLEVPDHSLLEPLTRQMATAGRVLVPPRRRQTLIAKRAIPGVPSQSVSYGLAHCWG